jgi:hypothetical protein
MEEEVVLRRGPSDEKSTVVLVPPSVPVYTNSLAPTSWKDSQPHGEEEQRREKGGHEGSQGPRERIPKDPSE